MKISNAFWDILLALILTGHCHLVMLWTVLSTCLRVAVWTELHDEMTQNYYHGTSVLRTAYRVFCDGYPLTELMRDTNSIHFLVISYFEHSYILCVQCYVHVICYFSAFSKLTLKLSAHVSRVYLYAQ